jgi:hypothetical protein
MLLNAVVSTLLGEDEGHSSNGCSGITYRPLHLFTVATIR